MTPSPGPLQAAPSQAGPASAAEGAAHPLAEFVALESLLRNAADVDDLRAVLCNSSRKALAFRQAFVIERDPRGWRVTAASSVSAVDAHAPLLRALAQCAGAVADEARPAGVDIVAALARAGMAGAAYPFPHGLLAPLGAPASKPFAAALFVRDRPWREQDHAMAEAVAETAAHAWRALQPRRRRLPAWPERKLALAAAPVLLLLSIAPVSLSALAPAEVVARSPVVVAAPLDGVVAALPVAPNMRIEQGDVILTFVDTKIRNDREIAERNRTVAAAKLHRVVQSSFGAPKDSHDIAIARAELDLAAAEAARAQEFLERSVVRAEKSGILVYTAPEDWIGKPVAAGERIMDIVDPSQVELRIDLAVADVIALQKGAVARFFPDGNPLDSRDAVVERTGYKAIAAGEGLLAYRNVARFEERAGLTPRVGARGTAKLYGPQVPLILYLLRRPFAALRQQVGL